MRRYYIIGTVLLVAVCAVGLYFFIDRTVPAPEVEVVAESLPARSGPRTIGRSVEGRPLEAFTFGTGDRNVLFVGGVHGGYEWNSILLAYEALDYFALHPEIIPRDVSVTIIPNANPDGLVAVLNKEGRFTRADVPNSSQDHGRFNARDVDLNRNFDCKWQATSTWRGREVSAGTAPFSEPESQALRDFVLLEKPEAVIFWHSQANAVYASECNEGILPFTRTLMQAYADASKYPAVDTFDAYPVTGDAEGWLASINVPAITVELSTHETIEWEKNLAGIKAALELF